VTEACTPKLGIACHTLLCLNRTVVDASIAVETDKAKQAAPCLDTLQGKAPQASLEPLNAPGNGESDVFSTDPAHEAGNPEQSGDHLLGGRLITDSPGGIHEHVRLNDMLRTSNAVQKKKIKSVTVKTMDTHPDCVVAVQTVVPKPTATFVDDHQVAHYGDDLIRWAHVSLEPTPLL
jgi:hypothetical protein